MARRHRHRQYHFRRTDRRTRAVQRPTGEPGNHSIVLVTEAGRGRNRWPIAARDWRRDDPSSSGRMVKAARRPWLEALSSVRSRTARQDQNNCPPETERRKSDSPVSGVHTRRQRVKRSRTTAAFVARSRHMRGLGECVVETEGLELRARHAVLSNWSHTHAERQGLAVRLETSLVELEPVSGRLGPRAGKRNFRGRDTPPKTA